MKKIFSWLRLRPKPRRDLRGRGKQFYKQLSADNLRLVHQSQQPQLPSSVTESTVPEPKIGVPGVAPKRTLDEKSVPGSRVGTPKTYLGGRTLGASGSKTAFYGQRRQNFARKTIMLLVGYLNRVKIKSAITGYRYAPQALIVEIELANEADFSKLSRSTKQLDLALKCDTGSVSVENRSGQLSVVVSLTDEMRATVYIDDIAEAALGVDLDGSAVHLPLNATNNAALVAGLPGSGKSELLKTMIYQLASRHQPSQIELVIVDHRHNLTTFDGLAHLIFPRITSGQYANQILMRINDAALRRRPQEPPIYIFIDEVRELAREQELDAGLLGDLANKRQFGVYLIVGSQKTDKESISDFASWCATRFVGQVSNAQQSSFVTGVPGSHAEQLAKRGDFLMVTDGKPTRFQVALTSDEMIARLPKKSRRPNTPSLVSVPIKNDEPETGRNRSDYYIPALLANLLNSYLRGTRAISIRQAKKQYRLGQTTVYDHIDFAERIYNHMEDDDG